MLNKKLVLGSLAGASLLVGAAILLPSTASALGLMSGTCVNCHTMHDSVDGTQQSTGGPNAQLLKWNGCVGCHSIGVNVGVVAGHPGNVLNAEPYAPQIGTETSGNQNGGGYFNVAANSHNVTEEGLATATGDYAGDVAPGGSFPTTTAAVFNCVDCHGDAVGGHHTYTAQTAVRTGGANDSYRMLRADTNNDNTSNGTGVVSLAQAASYAAPNRDGAAIDAFCADCHSTFHTTQGDQATGWIRHPTGVTLASAKLGTYTDPTGDGIPTGDIPAGTALTVDRLVMCVSCHAAHGTANSDMLRFSYGTSIAGAGGATAGCESCHTAK